MTERMEGGIPKQLWEATDFKQQLFNILDYAQNHGGYGAVSFLRMRQLHSAGMVDDSVFEEYGRVDYSNLEVK